MEDVLLQGLQLGRRDEILDVRAEAGADPIDDFLPPELAQQGFARSLSRRGDRSGGLHPRPVSGDANQVFHRQVIASEDDGFVENEAVHGGLPIRSDDAFCPRLAVLLCQPDLCCRRLEKNFLAKGPEWLKSTSTRPRAESSPPFRPTAARRCKTSPSARVCRRRPAGGG